jgi:hypothetical protein
MVKLSNDYIAIYGGLNSGFQTQNPELLNDLYILNIDSMQWVHPVTGGMIPAPRYSFSMCPGETGNEMYVFGGLGSDQIFVEPEVFKI